MTEDTGFTEPEPTPDVGSPAADVPPAPDPSQEPPADTPAPESDSAPEDAAGEPAEFDHPGPDAVSDDAAGEPATDPGPPPDESNGPDEPYVPDGQPSWLTELVRGFHDRLRALGG